MKTDLQWEGIRQQVWKRDYGVDFPPIPSKLKDWKKACRFWKCLTAEEQKLFLELNKENLWLCKDIDCAHYLGKGAYVKHKYDVNNVGLINRLAHSRLDAYQCPIDGKPITREIRLQWFTRIKK